MLSCLCSSFTMAWVVICLQDRQHTGNIKERKLVSNCLRLRVAFITRDYPSAIGGIATHAAGLVNALRKNVDVELFVGGTDYKTLVIRFHYSFDGFDW